MTVRTIVVAGTQVDVSGSGYIPKGDFSIKGVC